MTIHDLHRDPIAETYAQCELDEHAQPLGTCLGPGVCQQCGRSFAQTVQSTQWNAWGCFCEGKGE